MQEKVLLPVWLNVSHADVVAYSPSLAGRLAAQAGRGVEAVASEIAQVVRPQGSPLIVARDLLRGYDVPTPVVTDEYWLDVAEAANRVSAYGAAVPEQSAWIRWAFPLPDLDGTVQTRGERLAWTALQLRWTEKAEELRIDPTTPPSAVLDFIAEAPGLDDTCAVFPDLLIEYAPQLSIRGFGGFLEDAIESGYRDSLKRLGARRSGATDISASIEDQCEDEWVLRHHAFGGRDSSGIAYAYFHGGMFGPQVAIWEDTDHLFWLLSRASDWLPASIHEQLLDGLARMTRSWPWYGYSRRWDTDEWPHCGALESTFLRSRRSRPSQKEMSDLVGRAELAKVRLGLHETARELADRFLDADIVGRFRSEEREIRASQRRRRGRGASVPKPSAEPG